MVKQAACVVSEQSARDSSRKLFHLLISAGFHIGIRDVEILSIDSAN